HVVMEAAGVLDRLARISIEGNASIMLISPRHCAVTESLGEDDRVTGSRTRVAHNVLVFVPQGDLARSREVGLMASRDGTESSPALRLVGQQELDSKHAGTDAARPAHVPGSRLHEVLTKVHDLPVGSSTAIEHLRVMVEV